MTAKDIAVQMKKKFGYTNDLAVPRIKKIVLNVGLSKGLNDKKFVDTVLSTLQRISGQKPITTKAKKSISNFKIRQGMVVGAKVTMRGKRLEDFLTKLIHVALPRMRDFHGLDSAKGFDANGNYTLGFTEHLIFPEIASDEVENIHGLEVTIATSAATADEARHLLQVYGFPFKTDKK